MKRCFIDITKSGPCKNEATHYFSPLVSFMGPGFYVVCEEHFSKAASEHDNCQPKTWRCCGKLADLEKMKARIEKMRATKARRKVELAWGYMP